MDNCRHVKKYVFQFTLQLNTKNDIVILSTTKYLLYLLKQLCITKVYRERPKIHADGDILLLEKKEKITYVLSVTEIEKKQISMLRINALRIHPPPTHTHTHKTSHSKVQLIQ